MQFPARVVLLIVFLTAALSTHAVAQTAVPIVVDASFLTAVKQQYDAARATDTTPANTTTLPDVQHALVQKRLWSLIEDEAVIDRAGAPKPGDGRAENIDVGAAIAAYLGAHNAALPAAQLAFDDNAAILAGVETVAERIEDVTKAVLDDERRALTPLGIYRFLSTMVDSMENNRQILGLAGVEPMTFDDVTEEVAQTVARGLYAQEEAGLPLTTGHVRLIRAEGRYFFFEEAVTSASTMLTRYDGLRQREIAGAQPLTAAEQAELDALNARINQPSGSLMSAVSGLTHLNYGVAALWNTNQDFQDALKTWTEESPIPPEFRDDADFDDIIDSALADMPPLDADDSSEDDNDDDVDDKVGEGK